MDYFTADLHLGHARIVRYCRRQRFLSDADRALLEGYARVGLDPWTQPWKGDAETIAAMDAAFIGAINAVVRPEDRLWIIGDFAFARDAAGLRAYREAIACQQVHLIWGNHDRRSWCRPVFTSCTEAVMLHVHPQGTFTEEQVQEGLERRDPLFTHPAFRRQSQKVFLSHYAHVIWPGSHAGVFHLYGHSHGNLEPWREKHMPNALSMDVGVDVQGYAPVSFAQVAAMMAAKRASHPPHTVDHHRAGGPDDE